MNRRRTCSIGRYHYCMCENCSERLENCSLLEGMREKEGQLSTFKTWVVNIAHANRRVLTLERKGDPLVAPSSSFISSKIVGPLRIRFLRL